MIHRRRVTALVLTVFTLALGAILVAAYGRVALLFYLWDVPVPLALLWASTSAERFDERGEEGVTRPEGRRRTSTC